MLNQGLLLVLVLVSLLVAVPLTSASSHLTVTAVFNQSGVYGGITFSQEGPDAPTIITVNLTGLNNFPNSPSFPWHVHNYPFPHDSNPTPCGAAIVGGHYDPLGAILNPNYTTICNSQAPNRCEVGDLSGKFGNFQNAVTVTATYTDNTELSLYGIYSILGRSIVIHYENGDRLVCANIPVGVVDRNTPSLLYSPYRNDFVGTIYFRQHSTSTSTAKVYTDLVRIIGSQFSSGHNWHVHDRALDAVGMDCGLAGPHYNPRNVNVSEAAGYFMRCGNLSIAMQRECEIGDLSNKGAPFNVNNGVTKQLYTDTDLPLFTSSEGFQINGLSTVIHNESLGAPRIACANISIYQPLQAIAIFNENGVSGSISFYQHSPFDPTVITVNLEGLRSIADGYHVHAYSVGTGSSPGRCDNRFTGGHWNPHGIMQQGKTSDQFEVGDLSGKFGYLRGLSNINGVYMDPNVPLFGPYSILRRSIVIHQSDPDGTRWVCSDIQHMSRVVQVTTNFNTNLFSGRVLFYQPADDPYSETTIVVEINVLRDIPLTANNDGAVEYAWSYINGSNDCSTLSTLDAFSNNPQLCSTTQQLACLVGNLAGKHGNLPIPRAAGSTFRAVYADPNLPLSGRPGLESVFGGSLTGRLYLWPAAGGDASNSVCQQSSLAVIEEAPTTAGAPALSHVSAVFVLSVSLLSIVSSVLSW